MQLRWSEEAADDLERITNYLFEDTPQHAPERVRAIYNAPRRPLAISPSRAARQEGRNAGAGAYADAIHILGILQEQPTLKTRLLTPAACSYNKQPWNNT